MNNGADIFTGTATAVITPFKDGKIDYSSYEKILEFQIENGIKGIVVCGTTGEASTLSDDEHIGIIDFTVKKVNGRVPVIAGTGSNDTAYAAELSKKAEAVGSDALLHVTPYYNKATQTGLIRHFTVIADSVGIPVVLYNVPSRTGMKISVDTYAELAKHPNIRATKEASGDIAFIAEVIARCGDDLTVYSGNDNDAVPLMSLGAKGLISVISNTCPKEMVSMTSAFLNGDHKTAAEIQLAFYKLWKAYFMEVNPVPVKTAMAKMGFCEAEMRLPLCGMDEKQNEKLYAVMSGYGLL